MSADAITAPQFAVIVEAMLPGESVVYFTGHLGEAAAKSVATSQLRDMAQRLSTMWMRSSTGMMYAGMGMIALSQLKVEGGYQYIAVRL